MTNVEKHNESSMSNGPKDEENANLQASEFVTYVYVLPGYFCEEENFFILKRIFVSC